MMPLVLADTGEEAIIKRVGGSPEMKKHLEDMGFMVGGAVTVMNTIGGNLIVKIKESRVDPELIEGAYTLEVSSPGIDRPLKSMADFERNKGRLLRVTRSTGKPVTGELLNADEENLTLKLKGNAGEIVIPRSEVLSAKVEVEIK